MDHLLSQLESKLVRYEAEEQLNIMQAARWAQDIHKDHPRASGEPYLIHPIKVAEILIDLEMDADTTISALLHDAIEDSNTTREDIEAQFGAAVADLVEGVTKISIIQAKSKSVQKSETIRKMLLAMTKDIRVILIKLADKLHNMSTLEHLPVYKQRETAAECLDIYAPLADRLGIFWLKAELEDLSLKFLNRNVYDQIRLHLAAKKTERAEYLEIVENAVRAEAESENISVEVFARAKHFYSIYRKMKYRSKELSEIYDLLGMRILCEHENECYTMLGLVHRLWPPLEGKFKDYIAMPKANGYRSLHTVVMSPGGQVTEIQIRTIRMHAEAEYGVAAHWRYKSTTHAERRNSADVALINKLKSWDGLRDTSIEFLNEIKREILRESLYVFTPEGDIVELPTGSTAIDFAYHIHTEIGERCIGAKADGNIIPLTQSLKNTQVIEILTSNQGTPHVNWLRHAKTARARQKIRHWLNHHDESLIVDRSIIAKRKPVEEAPEPEIIEEDGEIITHVIDKSRIVFKVGTERNMMIQIARCCNPTTGDDIAGYISRGRGIIVHKRACPNLKHINEIDQRLVDVEWEAVTPRLTHRFKVSSRMTLDLFSEIEGAVRKYKGHLIQGKLDEDARGNLNGAFTLEIEQEEDFKKILKSIRTIPSVLNIQSLS
jgi:GTP diphosphokinase / guanosine-3',5'-bis(diphosphate) 3'-diphosphatase